MRLSRFSLGNTHPAGSSQAASDNDFSLLNTAVLPSQSSLWLLESGLYLGREHGKRCSLLAFVDFLSKRGCILM